MNAQDSDVSEAQSLSTRRDADWRAFENGIPVLAVGATSLPEIYDYQEGLQEYPITATVWLRSLTVARQGEGHASQHIIAQRSTDAGKSWSAWFDVEPEGPPPSSYGSFFRHPVTDQVGLMYTLGPERDPELADGRPFYGHRHHVGQIAYRYVSPEGEFSERYILDLPLRAVDRINVFRGEHTLHYSRPAPQVLLGDDGYGWYTKLGPAPYVSNGEAFLVRYIGYAHNDRIEELELELLPRGEHGLQPSDTACICGIAPIALTEAGWFFKYRTTTGYAGLAVTRDKGSTWTVGDLTYEPGGRPVKNPEGPFGLVHDHQGRAFLTFYNDSYSIGFGSFAARDLVYISHIALAGGDLHVSEPELFYYRQDQGGYERHSRKRLNPPHVVVTDDGVYGEGADKLALLRFPIPERFFDLLATQATTRGIPQEGLILALDAISPEEVTIAAPELPRLADGGAFTLTFSLRIAEPRPRLVIVGNRAAFVLDGMTGRGIRVITWRHHNLLFAMSDGRHTVRLESDNGSLQPNQDHQVSIIVDGRPGLVSLVIDGKLQDGGTHRERGAVRFDQDYGDVNGPEHWELGLAGQVGKLYVHARALLTSEAIALQRAIREDSRGEG
jgi:hypothetical protein